MILVDTSIWIPFLSNRGLYASHLDELLSRDEVAGHQLIFGELLIGDRGGRKKFLALYERIHQVAPIIHDEVVAFVRHHRLFGRGVGWVDVQLLASAVVARTRMWTADPRFAAVAAELGVAYTIEAS